MKLFSKILLMAALGLTINTARADGPATIITKGPCPEGMAVVQGPHIVFDTATADDDNQNVTSQAGVCMEVSQTLILHASAPTAEDLLPSLLDEDLEPIADLGPIDPSHPSLEQRLNELGAEIGDLSNEVYEIGTRKPPPAAQPQKPGRWNVGILLGYPSKEIGAIGMATLSGTFRRGQLGELRLEGSAGMTDSKVGIFGGSALVYGHLSQHLLVGVGPTLTYETRFSKMLEEPSTRQLGGAIELAYQVKVSSPTNLDLELFGRVGAVWQRVDGPEMGPLADSAKFPLYLGWRALF